MKLHRIMADLDDNDYVSLARARVLVRRMFGLDGMPTNSQVVAWMLRSIPWQELESGPLGSDVGNSQNTGEAGQEDGNV